MIKRDRKKERENERDINRQKESQRENSDNVLGKGILAVEIGIDKERYRKTKREKRREI